MSEKQVKKKLKKQGSKDFLTARTMYGVNFLATWENGVFEKVAYWLKFINFVESIKLKQAYIKGGQT